MPTLELAFFMNRRFCIMECLGGDAGIKESGFFKRRIFKTQSRRLLSTKKIPDEASCVSMLRNDEFVLGFRTATHQRRHL